MILILDTEPAPLHAIEEVEEAEAIPGMMIRSGYEPDEAHRVWVKMNKCNR